MFKVMIKRFAEPSGANPQVSSLPQRAVPERKAAHLLPPTSAVI